MTNESDNSLDKSPADSISPATENAETAMEAEITAGLPSYMQQASTNEEAAHPKPPSSSPVLKEETSGLAAASRSHSGPLSPFEMAVKHAENETTPPKEESRPTPKTFGLGAAVTAAEQPVETATAIAVEPDGTAHAPEEPLTAAEPEEKTETLSGFDEIKEWDYKPKDYFDDAHVEESKREEDPHAASPRDEQTDPVVPPYEASGKKKKGLGFGGKNKKSASRPAPPPKGPKPVYPSFAHTHPVLSVEQTMPASISSRIFNGLALFPILPLTLFFILQTVFTLDARELWFSDEIRHAAAFQNLLYHGKGLILEMNGLAYPDKPHLYFWFLRGLYMLLQTDGPMLHFTAAAVSGLLYLWSALALGAFAIRVDRRTNFAAGIILISCGYIMGTFHYGRMDLLFSALIICSHILIYRAFIRPENNYPAMIGGFALAGVATLVKGPLGLAFPLCSLIFFALWRAETEQRRSAVISLFAVLCGLIPPLFGLELVQMFGLLPDAATLPLEWGAGFLLLPGIVLLLLAKLQPRLRLCLALSAALMVAVFILAGGTPYFHWPLTYVLPLAIVALLVLWQVTPQRLFRPDFYAGLLAGILVACSWFAAIYITTGDLSFILNDLLKVQVLERAADTFHHKEAWYYYLVRLPIMFLPWTLLVFFLPWKAIFSAGTRQKIAQSRKPEGEGIAFLWCMVLSSVLLLSSLSGKILIYFLPVAPAVCLLMGRVVLGLAGKRAQWFRYGMAVFMAVAAALLIVASLMLFGFLPTPSIKGVPEWELASNMAFFAVPVLMLVAGAALWLALGSSRPEGVLLIVVVFATVISWPLAGSVAPSFDPVLSPKNQALLMRAYIDQGYNAATYRDYPGTYTFYSGKNIPRLSSLEEVEQLVLSGNTVIAMRASDLNKWENRPPCLETVHTQWIETRQFVLLACPGIAGLKPAPVPYKPGRDFISELLGLVGLESLVKREEATSQESAPQPSAPAPVQQPQDDPSLAPEESGDDAPPAPEEALPEPADDTNQHGQEENATPADGQDPSAEPEQAQDISAPSASGEENSGNGSGQPSSEESEESSSPVNTESSDSELEDSATPSDQDEAAATDETEAFPGTTNEQDADVPGTTPDEDTQVQDEANEATEQ